MEHSHTVNDAHFHVGQFRELYTSPKQIVAFMEQARIDRIAVSSTSVCDYRYVQALNEIKRLVRHVPDRIVPVLRVTPDMLKSGFVDKHLNSGIEWQCLKIHRLLGWSDDFVKEAESFVELAIKMDVPILFHTGGGNGEADAGTFEPLIRNYPQCTMILAHARPVEETEKLMKQYGNVWCDTAFQTAENVAFLVKSGLSERILWGTDYPIPRYFYPSDDMVTYYHNQLSMLASIIPETDFWKITNKNFNKIFCH